MFVDIFSAAKTGRTNDCPNSVEQIVEDDGSTAMLEFCGQLRRLTLESTWYMEVVCLHPFKNLLYLSISDTTWEYLFTANGGLEQLQSLEELDISDCEFLEVMIQGGDKDNDVVFPHLKKLSLRTLSSLSEFCSIPDTPLHFPSLEILYLEWCSKLEAIFVGPFVAPRLRELIVKGCYKLQWLFSGEENQVIELPCLDKLQIDSSYVMECLSRRPLKAAKLRKIKLSDCAKMEWLLLGNTNCGEDLELPSLERITIKGCLNIKSFSPAVLRAPKLQLVKVNDKSYSLTKSEDLNQLLQSIADQMAVDFGVHSNPKIQIESELVPNSEPKADTKLNPEPDTESDLGVETTADP
ncbi:putative late blight resistance protein homolog R1A-4 [Silene latifolia]|uniref:putative late blight resistance protein homolog R1A-4 n=1 Tax=Silene latifolia TaxID=37657 RepID=UPI003D7711BD